jgi:adenine deaminase
MNSVMTIAGHIIDIFNRHIYKGEIHINNGVITSIQPADHVPDKFILPGFVDAHIHIESSMVTPFEFAKVALGHGTIATVSDPHEIANVCGIDGVQYMINSAKNAGLKFFFGAPSCVPATTFEHSGATIDSVSVQKLLEQDDIWFLSEMMNWPGVLHDDAEVMEKIKSAHQVGKPVDGHAPGLMGSDALKYISAGIVTDHECYRLEEAQNKLSQGMKVIIREGSAAKNYNALHPLIQSNVHDVMFCSDDKHPDDLLIGHIDMLVKRSLSLNYDLYDVLTIACINPVLHYNLPVGLLRVGDSADFIVVNDLKSWKVTHTYVEGQLVYSNDQHHLPSKNIEIINNFSAVPVYISDILSVNDSQTIPVIHAIDGELITEKMMTEPKINDGFNVPDVERDILKICVINRYSDAKPAIGFIHNFGLKDCAIASTVAHDSHNIIAIGDDDSLICRAINVIIESKGGLSAVNPLETRHLALPIGGIMSDKSVVEIGETYRELTTFVKAHGCRLTAPYMTLSFMALLVIPKIKMSDMGIFDAETFTFYKNGHESDSDKINN